MLYPQRQSRGTRSSAPLPSDGFTGPPEATPELFSSCRTTQEIFFFGAGAEFWLTFRWTLHARLYGHAKSIWNTTPRRRIGFFIGNIGSSPFPVFLRIFALCPLREHPHPTIALRACQPSRRISFAANAHEFRPRSLAASRGVPHHASVTPSAANRSSVSTIRPGSTPKEYDMRTRSPRWWAPLP